mmetsp:Transcript_82475/g.229926  ORF Transcript_82475/g.229926 Transcript_82475/m.229926 type:complete len:234 (-) Transcript_82475:30-731(-)
MLGLSRGGDEAKGGRASLGREIQHLLLWEECELHSKMQKVTDDLLIGVEADVAGEVGARQRHRSSEADRLESRRRAVQTRHGASHRLHVCVDSRHRRLRRIAEGISHFLEDSLGGSHLQALEQREQLRNVRPRARAAAAAQAWTARTTLRAEACIGKEHASATADLEGRMGSSASIGLPRPLQGEVGFKQRRPRVGTVGHKVCFAWPTSGRKKRSRGHQGHGRTAETELVLAF